MKCGSGIQYRQQTQNRRRGDHPAEAVLNLKNTLPPLERKELLKEHV